MTSALILAPHTFDYPLSREVLQGELKGQFETFLKEMNERVTTTSIQQLFRQTVRIADRLPKALHRFFSMYNFFNGRISTTIGHLAANCASSENIFVDYAAANANDRIYAAKVGDALKDAFGHELSDPNYEDQSTHASIPHRVLSTGVRNAAAKYAGMSDGEKADVPPARWQARIMQQIRRGYNGAEDDIRKMAFGLGVHNMSEYLASFVEFPTVCDELFCRRKGEGFHQYLTENPDITVQGYTFPAMSWLLTHGGYNPETGEIVPGVEFEHLQGGFLAAAMMATKAAKKDQPIIVEEFFKGAQFCVDKFQEYFARMEKECQRMSDQGAKPKPATQRIASHG